MSQLTPDQLAVLRYVQGNASMLQGRNTRTLRSLEKKGLVTKVGLYYYVTERGTAVLQERPTCSTVPPHRFREPAQ